MTSLRVLGLAIGFAGILWIGVDTADFRPGDSAWAIAACLVGTMSYGLSPSLTKRHLTGVPPLAVAAGSQVGAAMVLLPAGLALWPAAAPSGPAWAGALVLGAVCTGLAYVIFFRLIADVSSSAALSVTYLIPLFGIAWGWIFLSEALELSMLTGGGIVILGTVLATGVWSPTTRPPTAATGPDEPDDQPRS